MSRLNKLLSENKVKELGIAEEYDNREYWTVEHLVDELFLKIAGTKVIINHNGKSLTIRKYYNQALRLLNWIPIAKPTPEFLVNISDLTPRIVTELKALTGQTCYNYVVNKQLDALFENIDFRKYHLSIAQKLKVNLAFVIITSSTNSTRVHSVSEAKRMESGHIIVNGMIASISTLYMVISKSEWECSNFNCSLQGSETFTPPLLVPPQKLDNTAGFNVKCFKCNSTAFNVNHTYRHARTIQVENVDKNAEEDNIDRLEAITSMMTHLLM